MIPYDLEFESGVTEWEILTTIRDLYSGYEMYFDKDGMFIFQLIPTCEHDDYVMDYTQFQGIVIEENSSLDFTTVKNATRVYGESIEYDYCAPTCTLETTTYEDETVYSIVPSLEETFAYSNSIIIGVVFPDVSSVLNENAYLTLNDTTYPITQRSSELTEKDGSVVNTIVYNNMAYSNFDSTDVFCFKYMSSKNLWVYAGMYQIEGYCEDNDENSPFAIDKIGYKLQVLSGGEYDDITTSTLAQERAEYENWLAGRMQDSITLNMVIAPFLETNKKVQYMKLSDSTIDYYITKSITYSFTEGTMELRLKTKSRGYPLT